MCISTQPIVPAMSYQNRMRSPAVPLIVNWKRIPTAWTNTREGPVDNSGRRWNHRAFDDSNWLRVNLPDQGFDLNADDRYYRASFEWDGQSAISIGFVSDDGLEIFVNGYRLGEWGTGWRNSGCVNNAPSCVNSTSVLTQTIPSFWLMKGSNVIAVDVWNASVPLYLTYFNLWIYGDGPLPVNPIHSTPIIMVIGWRGSPTNAPGLQNCTLSDRTRLTDDEEGDQYFKRLDDDLKPDYPIYFAHLITNPCYTAPLSYNADLLDESIERVKNEEQLRTGKRPDKVILIAHSMGGIVSRAYVERKQYENKNDVQAIFTLGSPHQGVPVETLVEYLKLIDPRAGLGLAVYCAILQPGLCEVSETGMKLFNLIYPERREGVRYYIVSGNAPFDSRNTFGKIMDVLIIGPDDGIVPTLSGVDLDRSNGHLVTDENHNVFGKNNYFTRDGELSNSYSECLKQILIESPEGTCSNSDLSLRETRALNVFETHAPLETHVLSPGQTVTRSIDLESGPALFAAKWQTGTVDFWLVDPNGVKIDPDYANTNPSVVSHSSEEGAAAYQHTNALSGEWLLVAKASSTNTSPTFHTTLVSFANGARLIASADDDWYLPGTTAIFTATLTGFQPSATVTATIQRADNLTDTITMTPTASGIYRADYIVPNSAGYVVVSFHASGDANGRLIQRESKIAFQIASTAHAFNGTFIEKPQMSGVEIPRYTSLDIEVGIHSTSNGALTLNGDLADASGVVIARGSASSNVVVGTSLLRLRFNGNDIAHSKRDGPYRLTNLVLTETSSAPIYIAQKRDAYQTTAFLASAFSITRVFLPLARKS
jgi:hypothetical protein